MFMRQPDLLSCWESLLSVGNACFPLETLAFHPNLCADAGQLRHKITGLKILFFMGTLGMAIPSMRAAAKVYAVKLSV